MSQLMIEDDDDNEYCDEGVNSNVTEPSDLDDPVCPRCGSTTWVYCTLGNHNKIKKCSDCPRRKDLH